MSQADRILVIKLGALGDIIQSFDAFHAIRAAHPQARITALTKPGFAAFLKAMPWVDEVLTDPRGHSLGAYLRIRRLLRAGRFDVVYDLQNQPRTRRYRLLLAPGPWPQWWGDKRFAGRTPAPKGAADLHNHDRMLAQLAEAGIKGAGAAPLDWLNAPVDALALPERFVAFVPGCSPQHPHKRWPAARYAELAQRLQAEQNLSVVALGTPDDAQAVAQITAIMPDLRDLTGQTSLAQLATVLRRASAVVGNDTGPVFLAAALKCPTLMLMSAHTNPARSAPFGPQATWLKREDLTTLEAPEVMAALTNLLPQPAPLRPNSASP